jgi:EmrB/QacA subfamily drug resistance transporter
VSAAQAATTPAARARAVGAAGAGLVLLTLASSQFLMTLDSSVMNVSIATVAKDVGTTVTGIQTAITLYTLVMACLMIVGGKMGSIIGRRRAFSIGCIIYCSGSMTTALAPNLPVLLLGWSLLEGIGAALIMPAIVALVAGNFPPQARPRAYGLIAAAGAMAVAVGPLVGGLVTTYASWRYVFASEVVLVIVILLLARRVQDAPPDRRPKLDVLGAVLSATGLALAVYGILRSSEWGWVRPKPGGAAILGLSPTIWLIMAGLLVIWLFVHWQAHLESVHKEPLVQLSLLANHQLTGGLVAFFFQFLLQAGIFFVVPLFLSVVLGLSALATGVRLLPLSVALLLAAAGVPKLWPRANPRRVSRIGILLLLGGIVLLLSGIDLDATAAVVLAPLMLVGLGIGCLASQLGAVTVSAVPDDKSPEVGGLQNTATNLGASIGTALAGSVLIAVLTASFLAGVQQNPKVPAEAKSKAGVELAGGVPFVSDADLKQAMQKAGASPSLTQAVVDANAKARVEGLHAALAVLAVLAIVALFFTQRLPTRPPQASGTAVQAAGP